MQKDNQLLNADEWEGDSDKNSMHHLSDKIEETKNTVDNPNDDNENNAMDNVQTKRDVANQLHEINTQMSFKVLFYTIHLMALICVLLLNVKFIHSENCLHLYYV